MSSPATSAPDVQRALAAEYVARQGARSSLANFMLYMGIATPDLPRHARYLCDQITRMYTDPVAPQMLVISMPPGSLKTTIARGLAAWRLAVDDSERILWATHRTDHALKQSRVVLDLLQTPRFQALSKTRLSDKSQSQATFETTHRPEPGGFVALGAGSGSRGYRVSTLVIDDPAGSAADAASAIIGEGLETWFERDLISRLLPHARVLVFAQRLAERDLLGYLQRTYSLDTELRTQQITLQMRATAAVPCPLGRAEGELLWPEFFDEQTCRMLESDELRWQSEYQQQPPSVTGGAWCKPEDVEIVDSAPSGLAIIAASDYALGESRGRGDYTVHAIIGLDHTRRIYLLDLWRSRDADVGAATGALLQLVRKHKPRVWLHEDSTIERALLPYIRERIAMGKVNLSISKVSTGGVDKYARAEPLQSLVRSGRVAFVRAAWNALVLQEWTRFPGRNDDTIDAVALAARVLNKMPAGAAPANARTSPLESSAIEWVNGTPFYKQTLDDMWADQERSRRNGGFERG